MTCCLTAPSHYLNQCWIIINSEMLWHSSDGNCTGNLLPSYFRSRWLLTTLPTRIRSPRPQFPSWCHVTPGRLCSRSQSTASRSQKTIALAPVCCNLQPLMMTRWGAKGYIDVTQYLLLLFICYFLWPRNINSIFLWFYLAVIVCQHVYFYGWS